MLKAAKEQQALDNEAMPNGGKKGMFRKSRKSSTHVLATRGTLSQQRLFLSVRILHDSLKRQEMSVSVSRSSAHSSFH